jgi:hypothetical protein
VAYACIRSTWVYCDGLDFVLGTWASESSVAGAWVNRVVPHIEI